MTEEAAKPAETSTHRKLTPAEWEQVVVLWESGTVTLQDLSDRFGISKPALHEGLKKRDAVKGRRASEFAKQAEESLKTEAARRIERIKGFKEEFHTYGDFIMKATIKELGELLKESPRTGDTKRRIFTALKYSAEIYALMRDQKFHLYDLYKEQEEQVDLPEIAVTEYDPKEIDAIKRRFDTVPLLEDDDAILESAHAALAEMETTITGD